MVGDEGRDKADVQTGGQDVSSPKIIAAAGRVAAVDADGNARQTGVGQDRRGQRGELLGKGDIGGGIVLRPGAPTAGPRRAVVIDLPTTVFLVADLPKFDA